MLGSNAAIAGLQKAVASARKAFLATLSGFDNLAATRLATAPPAQMPPIIQTGGKAWHKATVPPMARVPKATAETNVTMPMIFLNLDS